MEGTRKGVLINASGAQVVEIEKGHKAAADLIECDYIDIQSRYFPELGQWLDIYADDEGLFKEERAFYGRASDLFELFAGPIFVVGDGSETGDSPSLTPEQSAAVIANFKKNGLLLWRVFDDRQRAEFEQEGRRDFFRLSLKVDGEEKEREDFQSEGEARERLHAFAAHKIARAKAGALPDGEEALTLYKIYLSFEENPEPLEAFGIDKTGLVKASRSLRPFLASIGLSATE